MGETVPSGVRGVAGRACWCALPLPFHVPGTARHAIGEVPRSCGRFPRRRSRSHRAGAGTIQVDQVLPV
jgi:hypothetical protein